MKHHLLCFIIAAMLCPSSVNGQIAETPAGKGAPLGEAKVMRYRVGLIIKAVGGTCRTIKASAPVPGDWPEQEVKVVDEEITPQVKRLQYRTTDKLIKQMIVTIPLLKAGEEARAIVTFEVRRRAILKPSDPSVFVVPKRLSRDVRGFLSPSPQIESRDPRIVKLANELTADSSSAWQSAELIYDYVRDKLEYKQDEPLKGAVKALEAGNGDCEDYTSLMIALYRAKKIPARTVWVAGHCYPEFYLEDDDRKGHWIPCQSSGGGGEFGEMPEQLPIMQKGDNFRDPEQPRKMHRYFKPFLSFIPAKNGGVPTLQFVDEMVK